MLAPAPRQERHATIWVCSPFIMPSFRPLPISCWVPTAFPEASSSLAPRFGWAFLTILPIRATLDVGRYSHKHNKKAMHGEFLPQRVLACAELESAQDSRHAQGNPRLGKPVRHPDQSEGCHGEARSDEAGRGHRVRHQRDQRDADLQPVYLFSSQHRPKIGANNPMEQMPREAHWHTKVVGSFPDWHSAMLLVTARLCQVSATA